MPLLEKENRVQPADKGRLHGKCNRTACWNRPAICFSTIENAYYCVKCAREINHWLPKNVKPINIPQEPPKMEHLRVNGVGRDFHATDNVVIIYTNKAVTDGELRVIHDLLVDHFNTHGMSDADIAKADDPDITARLPILQPT